ncbi:MAG TPA: hypothetical protein VK453_06990 [Micromonosporaceae bacterium]|nr:hypothetical protein [Micromonosporaceae bacterium]
MTVTSSAASLSTPISPRTDKLLRVVLKLDAVVTAANGLMYLALAGPLHDALGVPTAVLYPVGIFLLLYGGAVWAVATRRAISRLAVWAIIAVNVTWALASADVVITDAMSATALGQVWLVLQALTVAGFAALQYVGLKRSAARR